MTQNRENTAYKIYEETIAKKTIFTVQIVIDFLNYFLLYKNQDIGMYHYFVVLFCSQCISFLACFFILRTALRKDMISINALSLSFAGVVMISYTLSPEFTIRNIWFIGFINNSLWFAFIFRIFWSVIDEKNNSVVSLPKLFIGEFKILQHNIEFKEPNRNQAIIAYSLILLLFPIILIFIPQENMPPIVVGVYVIMTFFIMNKALFISKFLHKQRDKLHNLYQDKAALHLKEEAAKTKAEHETQLRLKAVEDQHFALDGSMRLYDEILKCRIELEGTKTKLRRIEEFLREAIPKLPEEKKAMAVQLMQIDLNEEKPDLELTPEIVAMAKMMKPGTPEYNPAIALAAKAIKFARDFEIKTGHAPSAKEADRHLVPLLKTEAESLGLINQHGSAHVALVESAITIARANPKGEMTPEPQ